MVFNTNGKNRTSSMGKQCFNYLNNIALACFTSALAFTMPQEYGSDLYKHKKWLQKVEV